MVGTNGKSTTSNLIADSLEQAAFSVCCNRTGANLDSGIDLVLGRYGDWYVLEDNLRIPSTPDID